MQLLAARQDRDICWQIWKAIDRMRTETVAQSLSKMNKTVSNLTPHRRTNHPLHPSRKLLGSFGNPPVLCRSRGLFVRPLELVVGDFNGGPAVLGRLLELQEPSLHVTSPAWRQHRLLHGGLVRLGTRVLGDTLGVEESLGRPHDLAPQGADLAGYGPPLRSLGGLPLDLPHVPAGLVDVGPGAAAPRQVRRGPGGAWRAEARVAADGGGPAEVEGDLARLDELGLILLPLLLELVELLVEAGLGRGDRLVPLPPVLEVDLTPRQGVLGHIALLFRVPGKVFLDQPLPQLRALLCNVRAVILDLEELLRGLDLEKDWPNQLVWRITDARDEADVADCGLDGQFN
ncbi:hypothetical protein PoMZ_10358 [Pyricularia oryzae]|uniref:Uncharacterized protein n=1 Tax=Pyricularia oryzae TaxID=318829 RepID=A0A4P7N3Z2_PYROR|nr:hypothetical protein PoMZ_10358 [Pyricularia oryzae]